MRRLSLTGVNSMVHHTRIVRVFALLGAGVIAGGCAADRSTPTGITADLLKQTGLLQCSSLPSASVKQAIGLGGGTMKIGPHMFVVPPGALTVPVTIAAKTAGGTGNAVVFKPDGLIFLTPAYLTLSYANCSTAASTTSKHVAYTTDWLAVLSYVPSWDDPSTQGVTGLITHFSNYAIAW